MRWQSEMHRFAASTFTASRKLKRLRKDHQAIVSGDVRCASVARSQNLESWIPEEAKMRKKKQRRGRNHENV